MWTSAVDRFVLPVVASTSGQTAETFDVNHFTGLTQCHIDTAGDEHWQFSDGFRQIRLDLVEGTLCAGPVYLRYDIGGLASAQPKVQTLERLILLARSGRLAATRFPAERRAVRWALVLRVYDALSAGASQRDIAMHLYNLGDLARWRVEAPAYRRRVQRLVAAARDAVRHDPAEWLNGRYP
ncbi:hypothetical protein FHR23_003308 [Stakelama sediminis]|uniref:T6SS Transcription factor RovC-like DNA binding domain-containing protein n=1 Tax=Stakelama sediminis TaxID=463200 RepID=A0A840Z3Y7_9SPHN|nr:DUF2285 domain-containing protein [Stakelama sediminis]MBB5720342.1 hypothetical protein [Stakelama sediminis]